MQAAWLLCLLICCEACLLAGRADEPSEQKGNFTCGLSAAYIFLNRSGHHVEYQELVREFMEQKPPDSLLAIKNVVAKHGFRLVGIKAGADYFLDHPGPAIVYLQLTGSGQVAEDHFSYLVGATRQGGAEFLDPVFDLNGECDMTWDNFARSYQGFALVPHD
jgi:ABC-type bacteriocin/lantibiotic exporter with double-glycine peptidase domain